MNPQMKWTLLCLLANSWPRAHSEDSACSLLLQRQRDLHALQLERLKLEYESTLQHEREQHQRQIAALVPVQWPRQDEKRASLERASKKEAAPRVQPRTQNPDVRDAFVDAGIAATTTLGMERPEAEILLPARNDRLLLQAEESGRPCAKSTVKMLLSLPDKGPNNRTQYVTDLMRTDSACAMCVIACVLVKYPLQAQMFDSVRCINDCMHQNENQCLPGKGLEEIDQLVGKSSLHDRNSLISMMAATDANCKTIRRSTLMSPL